MVVGTGSLLGLFQDYSALEITFCENLTVLAEGELETMLSDFKALAALREVRSKAC